MPGNFLSKKAEKADKMNDFRGSAAVSGERRAAWFIEYSSDLFSSRSQADYECSFPHCENCPLSTLPTFALQNCDLRFSPPRVKTKLHYAPF